MTSNSKQPIAEWKPYDEITATYSFHPRLKNVIALFKENEQFKQTRGLIELISRLLKSVWERQANDVFLIGPQHFDLSIPDVRDKLTEISGMRDVIAKDLWDSQQSAHAQIIDLQTGKEAATQLGSLLLPTLCYVFDRDLRQSRTTSLRPHSHWQREGIDRQLFGTNGCGQQSVNWRK